MANAIAVRDLERLDGKLNDAHGAYFRRNSDGTISAYQRLNGQDIKAGRTRRGDRLTLAALDALRKECERVRNGGRYVAPAASHKKGAAVEGRKRKPVHPEVLPQAGVLGKGATFAQVWRDMLQHIVDGSDDERKWTPGNTDANMLRISRHLQPSSLWNAPIASLGTPQIVALLRPIRTAAPNQESKVRGLLSMVFTHARGMEIYDKGTDPVAGAKAVFGNTRKRLRGKRFKSYSEWADLRQLVADIRNKNGELSVRAALMLQAYTVQRTSEICDALWSEFDLDATPPTWKIPRARMKIKEVNWSGPDHQELHLPEPVAAFLRTLPRRCEFVFPNQYGTAPITGLDKAMRVDLGRKGLHVPHGWRSALETHADDGSPDSTNADGAPLFSQRWIDACLDHAPTGSKAPYIRAHAVEGGAKVLAWWCRMLGDPLG